MENTIQKGRLPHLNRTGQQSHWVVFRKEKVYKYIRKKILFKNKYWKRPKEINTKWVADKFGYTYREARYLIELLIKEGRLKRYCPYKNDGSYRRMSFFQLIEK